MVAPGNKPEPESAYFDTLAFSGTPKNCVATIHYKCAEANEHADGRIGKHTTLPPCQPSIDQGPLWTRRTLEMTPMKANKFTRAARRERTNRINQLWQLRDEAVEVDVRITPWNTKYKFTSWMAFVSGFRTLPSCFLFVSSSLSISFWIGSSGTLCTGD
ncbi:unnamed protein product [Ilex paraguariensis]|uniref:Uncharacterized protein n=1 Tax=Ilex paraguariensis TaxID=185542 RepID=A0ABC8QX64_9AQUA